MAEKKLDIDVMLQQRTDYSLKEQQPGEERKAQEKMLRLDLKKDDADQFLKDVIDELDDLLEKLEPFREEFQINEDQYDGILPEKDYPHEDSSNTPVPLTPEKVDAVTARATKAIIDVDPIWIVEPIEDGDVEVCKNQEKFLDFISRNEIDYEEAMGDVIFESVLQGTGIMELPWVYEVDRIKDVEEYQGEQGMMEFLKNYPEPPKDEKKQQEYFQYLERIKAGETVNLLVEYNEVVYNAPKPTHVPLKDFVIDPECTDLRRSHLHGKQFKLRGDEIRKEVDKGFYDNVIAELEKGEEGVTSDEEKKNDFLTTEFTCYKLVVKYAFPGDKSEKKYLCELVYDTENNKKLLLRLTSFPYWHNRTFFIPFYISRRKNGFFRDGLGKILRHPQEAVDVLYNVSVDAAMYAAIPTFKANKNKKASLGPQMDKGIWPGKTLWVDEATDLEPMVFGNPNLGYLEPLKGQALKFGELRSGVNQSMTGQEAPNDPNAPARKTEILLQESNIRVGSFIKQLQRSNREAAFQIVQLYYQFENKDKTFRIMGDDGKYTFPQISRQEIRMRADYRPHGSVDVLTKVYEKENNLEAYKLGISDPVIAQDPFARRYLLETMFKSLGGDWDKKAAKVVPTEEAVFRRQVEIYKQAITEMEQKKQLDAQVKGRATELLSQGMDENQVRAQIEKEFPTPQQPEGQGQPKQPGQAPSPANPTGGQA